jgi:hypothetical protein
MKYIDVYKQLIIEGFSEEVSLGVIQALTINMSKKIKKKHLTKESNYTAEIIDSIHSVLFMVDNEDVELIINLWECSHDWSICNSMQGLGGCTSSTFTELLLERSKKL